MPTTQWDFLKEYDTSLGVFYPLHYIIAGYPDMQSARDAESAFRGSGKPVGDVRAATGGFVAERLENQDEETWLDQVQAAMVKFMGTEMGYLAEDKRHARDGGAFLFVYAPDDESLAFAREVFERHPPVYARRYLRVAIENIVENPNAL